MLVKIKSGDEVMAPHPRDHILKTACVLVVMPELVIIEYYEDKMRHCLPKGAIRVLAPPVVSPAG